MGEICEICGREFGDEPSQCFLRNGAAGLLEEAECLRLGYERTLARADRYEAEFAACKALLIAEQKRAERAEAERSAVEAKYSRMVGLHTEEERLRWRAETKAIASEARASEARAALEAIRRLTRDKTFPFPWRVLDDVLDRALAALPVEPARRQVTENANALGAPAAGCSEEMRAALEAAASVLDDAGEEFASDNARSLAHMCHEAARAARDAAAP